MQIVAPETTSLLPSPKSETFQVYTRLDHGKKNPSSEEHLALCTSASVSSQTGTSVSKAGKQLSIPKKKKELTPHYGNPVSGDPTLTHSHPPSYLFVGNSF